jgi:hypothetical protein
MNFMNIEHRTSIGRRTRVAWLSVLGGLAIGLVLSSVAQTNSTNSAASTDPWPAIDTFNIIQRNNIFDPNRRPRIVRTNGPTPSRTQAFALKGTMSYTKGRFAFFDGTLSEYNKVLGVGGVIAGYTVKEITATNVTLAASGKEFKMAVGRQVRNSGGKWQMGQPVETTDEATGEDGQTADSSTPPVGANAQMSEILKRLMEAKAQELKELK